MFRFKVRIIKDDSIQIKHMTAVSFAELFSILESEYGITQGVSIVRTPFGKRKDVLNSAVMINKIK